MKRFLYAVLVIVLAVSIGHASAVTYQTTPVNGNLASTQTYVLDCSATGTDYLSWEACFSTPTYGVASFGDGVKSTGTIYIATNSGVHNSTVTIMGQNFVEGIDWTYSSASSTQTAYNLWKVLNSTYGLQATGYLTVLSTYSLVGSSFAMYGNTFVAGTDWQIGTATYSALAVKQTASSIYSDLANYFNTTVLCALNTSSITFTYNSVGTAGNNTITCWVTSMTASGMSGGTPAPLVGISFSSSNVLASSVITATATTVSAGGNYKFSNTVSTSMVMTGMSGYVASNILYAPFSTIATTQTYPTGCAVNYVVTTGSGTVGLTSLATYYVLNSNGATLQLATTRDTAVAGNAIQLLDTKSDRGAFTLTAVPATGVLYPAGFYWQASNDGINYYNLAVTSETIYSTTTYSTMLWDFARYDYEFIRCVFNPAVNLFGSVYLKLIGYGEKVAP